MLRGALALACCVPLPPLAHLAWSTDRALLNLAAFALVLARPAGVLLWYLVTGKRPYEGLMHVQVRQRLRASSYLTVHVSYDRPPFLCRPCPYKC